MMRNAIDYLEGKLKLTINYEKSAVESPTT
ncbi:hypothetical protein BTTAP_140017 [Brochothrix thermosphacta]|nr:hypothetical protein BTTAP_140017 [Brochothrix thermosphacta]